MLEVNPKLTEFFLNGRLTSGEYISSVCNSCFVQLKEIIFTSFSEVLPLALTVAGSVLVVNLGWRLFRNFTKG